MNNVRDINRELGARLSNQRAEVRKKTGSRIAAVVAIAVFIGAFLIVLT